MNETGTSTQSPLAAVLVVLDLLCVGVGVWCGLRLLDEGLSMLVYRRLMSVRSRLARLLARFEAGRLVVAPVVAARSTVAVEGEKLPAAARMWPAGFAWLVRFVGWRAAGLGGQLQHVLERPEMVELLASVPQVRRMLSPICRMLAVPRSVLRPRAAGTVVEAVAAPAARTKRVRRYPPPVDWGRIPLPRGILSASRRGRFKPG